MEANAEISRQAQTISKLEQDLNRLDKSSDMTSKRLEAENNSLHLHLSKLEQQLLDAKLSYHDLQSNLKHTSNELVSSKQSQGTSSCVCVLHICKLCIPCSQFLLILDEFYFLKVAKTSNPIIYKHKNTIPPSEVAKTEAEAKLSRQKLEAAKEVSRLETEVDKLKILLRGTHACI